MKETEIATKNEETSTLLYTLTKHWLFVLVTDIQTYFCPFPCGGNAVFRVISSGPSSVWKPIMRSFPIWKCFIINWPGVKYWSLERDTLEKRKSENGNSWDFYSGKNYIPDQTGMLAWMIHSRAQLLCFAKKKQVIRCKIAKGER